MSRRQKVAGGVILPCVALVALLPLALGRMAEEDRRHGLFYSQGKTINRFLSSYCAALEAAHAEASPEPLLALYSDQYRAPGRGRWTWAETGTEAGVEVRHLRDAARADGEGSAGFDWPRLAAELAETLGGLSHLEETICKIDLIEELEPYRQAVLTVKIYLDGRDREGRLLQDRVFQRWRLANEGGGEGADTWRIVADELVEGVRVAGRGGVLAPAPESLGIDFRHRRDPKLDMQRQRARLKFGVAQHAGGGISAADYDRDGRPDLLLLDGIESRLYRNLGPGEDGLPRFQDVTEAAGLAGIGEAHAGLFADFDNDGDRDLFVARYLAPCLFFRNRGDGTFRDDSRALGPELVVPAASATLLDFDRDGFLDLYLGVNGNAFEAFPRLPFYARNGRPNRLLRNLGGSGFADVTAASGTGDTGWSLAVAAGDYDGDGWPDLAVANDFGRKSLYRNRGDGTFREVAKEAGVLDFGPGMGLDFGDFDDDGRLDLYTSNVNSNQRWFGEDITVSQYTRNVLRSRWALLDLGEYVSVARLLGAEWIELGKKIGEGNSLFRNQGDGTFREIFDSHADRVGWGWSVAFFDVENDTDLDLYAANGWISNTPGTDL